MRTLIRAHACEIELGDRVSFVDDHGEQSQIEARRLTRDCGVVHVWETARVVSFPAMYPVEVLR